MVTKRVKILKSVALTLKTLLNEHIKSDEKFFSELKKCPFVPEFKQIEPYFKKIHEKIKKDLDEAEKQLDLIEQKIKEGKNEFKEIVKIMPLFYTFNRFLWNPLNIPLGYKSEFQILQNLNLELSNKKLGKPILILIQNQIETLKKFASDSRLHHIADEFKILRDNAGSYFVIKKDLVNFLRPKIQKVKHFGNNKIYINIFFDKKLKNKNIKEILENQINFLRKMLNSKENKTNLFTNPVRSTLEKKIDKIKNLNLDQIQKLWLEDLEDLVLKVLSRNKNIILTPSLRYNIKLLNYPRSPAYSRSDSAANSYDFGIDINYFILIYLITENFYESFPSRYFIETMEKFTNFKFLNNSQIIHELMRDYKQIEYMKERLIGPKNKRNNLNEINLEKMFVIQKETDLMIKKILILSHQFQDYRYFSLYNVLTHETQHAFDSNYLQKNDKLNSFIFRLIGNQLSQKGHYNLHPLKDEIYSIIQTYFTCRAEAPTQFREIMVPDERTNKKRLYSSINPIPILGNKDIIKNFNDLFLYLEKENPNRNFLKRNYDSKGHFGYQISHFINMIILIYYCKKYKIDLVILKIDSLVELSKQFPKLKSMLSGLNKISNFNPGDPEKFLFDILAKGDTKKFIEILEHNKISRVNLDNIKDMLDESISKTISQENKFFLFKPPLKVMEKVLKLINRTDEITYFKIYLKACDYLNIPENYRIISPTRIRRVIEKIEQSKKEVKDFDSKRVLPK